MSEPEEPKKYWYRLDFGAGSLTLNGGNWPYEEEQVAQWAMLLAATWNRRHKARNCDHDWVEPTTLAGEVVPSVCSKCGVTTTEWAEQEAEEAIIT